MAKSKLLTTMGTGQGYLKAGFLGFAKSGKTYTAAQLATGTREMFRLEGPIAMFDTEGGAEYIAGMVRKATGKDLIGIRSRSFDDLVATARECETSGVSVLICDSMTHPWRELCNAYLREINAVRAKRNRPSRTRLEFQDWSTIKERWAVWADFFLNAKLHIIICGRAGYEWEFQEQEDSTGGVRNELVKTGIKMKTETEFGFEPSLLVQMERVQDLESNGRITHRATVIGDRFAVLDGKTADNPTFDFFRPHLELLTPGQHAPVDTETHSTFEIDESGDAAWQAERKERTILCEKIEAEMVLRWPGQKAEEKRAKKQCLEDAFGTTSWTEVENIDRKRLEAGLSRIKEMPVPETDK